MNICDELRDVYKRYLNFDRYSKETKQKIEKCILESEKRYHRIKQKDMALPTCVLAFKLLEASGSPHQNQKLVLTGADYTNKDGTYDQMEDSFKNLHGDQAIPESSSRLPIKQEPSKDRALDNQHRPFYNNRGGYQTTRYSREQNHNNSPWKDRETNPVGYNGKPII